VRESILESRSRDESEAGSGAVDRWLRGRVCGRLSTLRSGALTLIDAEGAERFGDPGSELRATVHVLDPRFYRALVRRGALGGAEAYMDGYWWSDDLTATVRILASNRGTLQSLDSGLARWALPSLKFFGGQPGFCRYWIP